MTTIPTTRERGLQFKTRIGEPSVTKRLIFRNEDGSDHAISTYDFELLLKQQPGATTNIFRLIDGEGLTISGNEMAFQLTEAQASRKPNVYLGLIRSQAQNQTWFNVDWEFFNGKYEGTGECDETSVTVCLDGEDIIVTVASCEDVNTDTRSISTTSTATLTPNIDLYDLFVISAQSTDILIANPTGTAVLGNGFMIDLDDNGSARAITYGNLYDDTFFDLPSTTIAGKRMKLVFQYSGTTYELVNVINEQ